MTTERSSSRSKARGGGLLRRMKCGDRADIIDDSEVPPRDGNFSSGANGKKRGTRAFRSAKTSAIDARDEIDDSRGRASKNGFRALSPSKRDISHSELGKGTSSSVMRGWSSRPWSKNINGEEEEVGTISLGKTSIKELENKQVVFDTFIDDPERGMNVRTFDSVPMAENPHDVVIRVKASTVSYKDCIIRKGMWSETIDLPAVPGFDCIGVVESIGDDVNLLQEYGRRIGEDAPQCETLKVGDPVAALVQTGGNARYITVDASRVFRIPSGDCDSAQAACVLSSYMTAYQVLHRARPRDKFDTLEGKSVLITGGIGPVGLATVELALRAGATVVYATIENQYHATLKERHPKGNVIPLPLCPSLWLPHVKGKMDCVVDGMCQDGYESPRAALNDTGILVCIGANTVLAREGGPGVLGAPVSAMWANTKAGYLMGSRTKTYEVHDSFRREPERFRHDMMYLFGLLSLGKIKPSVAEKIGLEDVPKMHCRMERGEICGGVVVVKPWQKRRPYK